MAKKEAVLTPSQLKELNDRAAAEENFEQKMAFETYYKLGDERSLAKLAKDIGKAKATVEIWSTKFRWQARVVERDKAAAEYTFLAEAAKKNSKLKEQHLQVIDATISQWVGKLKDGEIKLKGVDDLQRLLRLRWQISDIPDQQVNPTHARSESGVSIDLRLRDMDREELHQFLYSTLKSIERVSGQRRERSIVDVTPTGQNENPQEPTAPTVTDDPVAVPEEADFDDSEFDLIDLDDDLNIE